VVGESLKGSAQMEAVKTLIEETLAGTR
jgi:hypothetical protein